jgi:hypothetical protein
MSINIYQPFETKNKVIPFGVIPISVDEKKYISVEPLSILYDSYSNSVVNIQKLGELIEVTKDETFVYLSFDIVNNSSISNAEIIISTVGLPASESVGNFPYNDYKLTKIRILLDIIVNFNPNLASYKNHLRSYFGPRGSFNIEKMDL